MKFLFRSFLLLTSYFIINISSFAQTTFEPFSENQNVGRYLQANPAPYEFTKYGGVPINMATGSPNVSVPLYVLKTKNLSHSLSMAYSTTGFKPADFSGRYGQYWNLITEGVINRTIYHADDDFSTRIEIPEYIKSGSSSTTSMNFLANYFQSANNVLNDTEYDIYSFSFGDYSGSFIFHNDSIVQLGNYGLNIERLGPLSFLIQDQQGVKYYFGVPDMMGTLIEGAGCSMSDYTMNYQTWFMTDIVHPNGDYIKFEFDNLSLLYSVGYNESEASLLRISLVGGTCQDHNTQYLSSKCTTYINSQAKILSAIQTSSGIRVELKYNDRYDIINEKKLSEIVIKNTIVDSVLERINFHYVTVGMEGAIDGYNNKLEYRDFLSSVIFNNKDSVEKNRYSFGYTSYTGISRLSKGIDYWGYFNGHGNTKLIYVPDSTENRSSFLMHPITSIANRNMNHANTQINLLNKIVYPTGGLDSISYEPHSYRYTGNTNITKDTTVTMFHITDNVDYTGVILESDEFTIDPQFAQVQFEVTFNHTGSGPVYYPDHRMIFYIMQGTTELYYREFTVDGNGLNSFVFDRTITGPIKMKLEMYGENSIFASIASFKVNSVVYEDVNKPFPGIRVANITSVNKTTDVTQKKYYKYSYLENDFSSAPVVLPTIENKSSFIMYTPCVSSGSNCDDMVGLFYSYSSNPVFSGSIFSGRMIMYNSVLASDDETFTNGLTQYLYYNNADNIGTITYGSKLPAYRMDHSPAEQGVLINTINYGRKNGNLVKLTEEIKDYGRVNSFQRDFYGAVINKNFEYACDPGGFNYSYTFSSVNLTLYKFDAEVYKLQRKWFRQHKNIFRDFSDSNNYFEKIDTLIYLSEKDIVHSISSSNYRGEVLSSDITKVHHLYDSPGLPDWLEAHKQANILSLPLQVIKTVYINGLKYVVEGEAYVYDTVSLGSVHKKYSLNINEPLLIDSFLMPSVIASELNFDRRFVLVETYGYDTIQGKPIVEFYNNVSRISEVIVWGYGNNYPVAKIVGVSYSEVKPLLNSTVLNSNNNSLIKSHLLSIKSSFSGIPDFYMEIYLYDHSLGLVEKVDIHNKSITYKYDTFNRLSHLLDDDGFVLNKYCYNYYNQVDDCSGSLFYSNAITRNYVRNNCGTGGTPSGLSYSITQGMFTSTISQADADNRASAYIDSIGQLHANTNAVCTFYNDAITQSFTKECTTGFVGSTHNYTIAAGSYSSTVSKVDANNIAQANMNILGQTNANTVGTCTAVCTTANCSGEGRKCINGVCAYGAFVLGECQYNAVIRKWVEYYYYRFPDNSVSEMYYREVEECIWDN
jgi:hypothetical protein